MISSIALTVASQSGVVPSARVLSTTIGRAVLSAQLYL
jgi:hypothetical protein